ncbi:AMP-dependent synthetase/ligase, partial [Chloroflexota bacterium]
EKWGSRVAMRQKEFGIWNEYTWNQSYQKTKFFALGLAALGMSNGDRVCLLGDMETELYWAMFATWCNRGISLGIWAGTPPQGVKHLLNHSETRFLIVRDQEQVDKALEIKEDIPRVERVIWWDHKGMISYKDPWLISFDTVIKMGQEYDRDRPTAFDEKVENTDPYDICTLNYTSGTTAIPKGVLRSYDDIIQSVYLALRYLDITENDDSLCAVPTAWFGEPVYGSASHLLRGLRLNFGETTETFIQDLRELSPRFLCLGTKQLEWIVSTIQERINDSEWLNWKAFNMGMRIGHRIAALQEVGQRPSLLWRIAWALTRFFVFRPTLDKFGLSNHRRVSTGGAMIASGAVKYMKAIGVNLSQSYGSVESGFITANTGRNDNGESVGTLYPEVEAKISKEGELLISGGNLFNGYFKETEATDNAFDVDGWYHTGDICYVDDERQLYFISRLADMRKLASGMKYAPEYIESNIRFGTYIRDCLVVGGETRDYVSAIIYLDFQGLVRWADMEGLLHTTLVQLSQSDEVAEVVLQDIVQANRMLPEYSRIRKYIVSHRELEVEEDMIFVSGKLRREFLEQKYSYLIEAIYNDEPSFSVEAKLTYRDGRTELAPIDLNIRSVA